MVTTPGTVSDNVRAVPFTPTGRDEADGLLQTSSAALLIGMILDQQFPIESAFLGPWTLHQRLGHLDVARIAAIPEDEFVAVACTKPAIHRFPAVMARRIHALCAVLPSDGSAPWIDARSGRRLFEQLRALPGFGDEKTQITVALLAKQFGVAPRGWKAVAGVFADKQPRSAADIDGPEGLARVRAWKTAQRAAGLDKQGRPTTPSL